MKQAVIVGAGISGLTVARLLAQGGYQTTILEKRNHIGGNVYDERIDGILVHKYGPHLFHTKMRHVAEFVQQFAAFFPYEHQVLGEIQGTLVPIPFNFQSIDKLFPASRAQRLKQVLSGAYPGGESVPVLELRRHPDEEVRELAEFVYQNVFYGYTKKQWGKPPQELDASVLGRVPVRMSYDGRYFTDAFQMMPRQGYAKMLERMAAHPHIFIRCACDARRCLQICGSQILFDGEPFEGPVVYTGCIDELFDYKYGRLPYRSLDFVLEKRNIQQAQPVVQVNYPNRFAYTRTSEYKLLQKEQAPNGTILVYEYPKACVQGDIPYYPEETKESRDCYNRYLALADQIPHLYLSGRLAQYMYCNMDAAIDHAMQLAQKIIEKEN